MTPTLEAYRLWAPIWDTGPRALVALEERHLGPWLPDPFNQSVIDVSCGTGRWLERTAKQGAKIIGFDFCHEMLEQAIAKLHVKSRLARADCCHLPLPSSCADIVVFTLTLGHVTPPEAAIQEVARITKPGGTILFSDFHPEAFRRGWKRTFRRDGVLYEVENYYYSLRDLLAWAGRAGLELEELLEPAFDEPERPLFEAAGRLDLYAQVRGIPAVMLARWRKTAA